MSYNHPNYYQQPNRYYYPAPPPQVYYTNHYPPLAFSEFSQRQQQPVYPAPTPQHYFMNHSYPPAPTPHPVQYARPQPTTPAVTRSRLLNLPSELLDQILSSRILTISDHLALAATSRSLRCCYASPPGTTTSPLWSALIKIRPFNPLARYDFEITESKEEKRLVDRIWSGKVDLRNLKVLQEHWIETRSFQLGAEDLDEDGRYYSNTSTGLNGNGKRVREERGEGKVWKVVRSKEWDRAIDLVNDEVIGKTEAKKRFNLNDKQMGTLKFQRGTSNRMWYRTAAVQSLVFEEHGGFFGHQAWMEKAAARSATRKRRPRTHGWFPSDSTSTSSSRTGSTYTEDDYEDQLAFKQASRDRMDELYMETDNLNYASAQAIKEVRERRWGS